MHATWNLLAKRAVGGAERIWLYGAVGVVLWAPVAFVDLAVEGGVTWAGLGFMLGSAILHIGYYGSLQRGYAHGDLSVVYPLARGTGPVLSVTAILFLGALLGAARARRGPPGPPDRRGERDRRGDRRARALVTSAPAARLHASL